MRSNVRRGAGESSRPAEWIQRHRLRRHRSFLMPLSEVPVGLWEVSPSQTRSLLESRRQLKVPDRLRGLFGRNPPLPQAYTLLRLRADARLPERRVARAIHAIRCGRSRRPRSSRADILATNTNVFHKQPLARHARAPSSEAFPRIS